MVGFLNDIVTNLLNPFLAPAPSTPEPVTPVVWAVLGWVRRNLFNQAPTITYNPTTTVQTGQTVTGNIGATDPEGDALTYTVTQQPQNGTLTIDQATGNFTYTPNDINYDAAQTDSFTVSVTDGKFNLLGLFSPHGDQADIDLTVLNPTVERVILNMPDGITNPVNPRYSARREVHLLRRHTDCRRSLRDLSDQRRRHGRRVRHLRRHHERNRQPGQTRSHRRRFGSGPGTRQCRGQSPRYSILEDGAQRQGSWFPSTTPSGGGFAIDKQREMRVSPDGTHVLFTRIVIGPTSFCRHCRSWAR